MKRLWKLAGLLGEHRGRVALGATLALATVLANIGLLALSSWFIASMAIAGLLGVAMAYNLPAAALRALAIIRAGGRYAERLVNHDTTFRILASLRLWFYRRIGPLAPARLAAFRSGDLLARIRADIDRLDDYYVRGILPAAVALLSCACILPFLSRYDPTLALIDGLALAAAGLAFPSLLAVLAARPGRARVQASAELRASIVEEVEGMAELVALGAAGSHARLMDEVTDRLDGSQRRLNSLAGLGEAGLGAGGSLAVWGASLVLVGLVAAGSLPPADLAGLTVFVLASFEAIQPLPGAIQKAGEMAAAARRLFDILDAEPEVAPLPLAEPWAGTGPLEAESLGISIRGLRFRYSPELPTIFEELSHDLPPGSRLGLAGPSGSG
jgi:ATP-binding cassette, subfamily C, bacterial CydC